MTESAQTFAKRYQELTGTKVNWGKLARELETQLKPGVPVSVQAAKLMPASRPPNSFTLAEYARDNNVSYTGARNAIRKLREAGKIRSVKMPVTYSNGYTVTTCGWVLIEGGGK